MNTNYIAQVTIDPNINQTPTTPINWSKDPLPVGIICVLLTYILTLLIQRSKRNKEIEEKYMENKYTNVLLDMKDAIIDIKKNMATKSELEEIKKNMATKDDIAALDTRIKSLEDSNTTGFDSITKAIFNWNNNR